MLNKYAYRCRLLDQEPACRALAHRSLRLLESEHAQKIDIAKWQAEQSQRPHCSCTLP